MAITVQPTAFDHGLSADPYIVAPVAAPLPPNPYVHRPRLTALLDRVDDVPLTLVNGPAGSGKTALVAAWAALRTADHDTDWITFEAPETSSAECLAQLVECLGRREQFLADEVLDDLIERPLAAKLARAVTRLARPLTIVLDGCEVSSTDVADDLDFVLRHAGGRLHLVIVSRRAPALPLYRYRLTGTMVEVPAAELIFTVKEAAELVQLCGVALEPGAEQVLTSRTGGWAAGLRFALLDLAASDQPNAAVHLLTGARGDIAEYLTAEVLRSQPEPVRTVLLCTSVVDVIQPGLVQELGGPAAARLLDELTRVSVFVEPAASTPGWYRVNPLLRDVLRAELAYRSPHEWTRLHLRAARWYAREGLTTDAVRIAARIDAWPRAARFIVENLALTPLITGQHPDVVGADFRRMPAEVNGPYAAIVRAALALADADPERCAEQLARAGAYSIPTRGRALPAAVEVLDAIRAGLAGDPDAEAVARTALQNLSDQAEVAPVTHAELAGVVHFSTAGALLWTGDLAAARGAVTAALRSARAAGCVPLTVGCHARMSLLTALDSDLRRAGRLATEALASSTSAGPADNPFMPLREAELALAHVAVEQDDLRAAEDRLRTVTRLGQLRRDPAVDALAAQVRAHLVRARDNPAGTASTERAGTRTHHVEPRTDLPSADDVIEPLTVKELEVLRHLSELLSTEETAAQMFVSVNTVRTHVRSILRKLAVSRRNEAVRRGRALGILAS